MLKQAFSQVLLFLQCHLLLIAQNAQAKDVYVNSYTRSDGTQVRGHYRSAADHSYDNNWSTEGNTNPYTAQGNTNPYTGERGTSERRGY